MEFDGEIQQGHNVYKTDGRLSYRQSQNATTDEATFEEP
mgnify:CR=1 FL=1